MAFALYWLHEETCGRKPVLEECALVGSNKVSCKSESFQGVSFAFAAFGFKPNFLWPVCCVNGSFKTSRCWIDIEWMCKTAFASAERIEYELRVQART